MPQDGWDRSIDHDCVAVNYNSAGAVGFCVFRGNVEICHVTCGLLCWWMQFRVSDRELEKFGLVCLPACLFSFFHACGSTCTTAFVQQSFIDKYTCTLACGCALAPLTASITKDTLPH